MITARVSLVESFRWWLESDLDWDWFIAKQLEPANEKMAAGTAFHKFMEAAKEGEFPVAASGAYRFHFSADVEIALPPIKEERRKKQYGNLIVTGKVDGLDVNTVTDYKLIINHQMDGEMYMDSFQWRYYLDIFGADVFQYLVFEAQEADVPMSFYVKDVHPLKQYRYPDLNNDCMKLAQRFYAMASERPELARICAERLED